MLDSRDDELVAACVHLSRISELLDYYDVCGAGERLPVTRAEWEEVLGVTDIEQGIAQVHLGMMDKVLGGAMTMIGKLHVVAIGALVYEAYPELHKEVDDLIRAVAKLLRKIKDLL